jgi:hypothetical protein
MLNSLLYSVLRDTVGCLGPEYVVHAEEWDLLYALRIEMRRQYTKYGAPCCDSVTRAPREQRL